MSCNHVGISLHYCHLSQATECDPIGCLLSCSEAETRQVADAAEARARAAADQDGADALQRASNATLSLANAYADTAVAG